MAYLPKNPNDGVDYSGMEQRTIYLAGGCFWGAEAYLRRVRGVAATECGYANGNTEHPTYEQVCREHTGHAETVKVTYVPGILSLDELLGEFFRTINPTLLNRQGGDVGSQYRSGIYYIEQADLPVIRRAVERIQAAYDLPVVTEVLPLRNYYPAEQDHQDYLEKNPYGYCHVDLTMLEGGGVHG